MANIKSQAKRNEINEIRRQKRASAKNEARTVIKNVEVLATAGKKAEAVAALPAAVKALDELVGSKIISKNSGSRKKSHLQLLINSLK